MERNNDFQKTSMPARKWFNMATGSKTTRQDKLYSDIYGFTSNGHSTNGLSASLQIASNKRQNDDSADILYDAKRNRIIDIEPRGESLPRKKLFVSTKASYTQESISGSVPWRNPLVTPANESTAAELFERQEEGIRRQLETVREKLCMVMTNRRYEDDDSYFTIRDRRIESNLYFDFTEKEWKEYSIKEKLSNATVKSNTIFKKSKIPYRERKLEATRKRKQAAADSLFSEPLCLIPCTSKKARIEKDTRQN